MRKLQFLLLAAVVMPLAAFAAAESDGAAAKDEQFRVINPQIDSWALGSVTEVNSNTGEVKIQGSLLPFATAHAQMRQELRQKTAGIQDREQRRKIAQQVRKDWNDRLQAAIEQKADAPKEFSFKSPTDKDDLVILDSKDIREMPAFQKMHAMRERRKAHNEAAALESVLSEGDEAGGVEGQPTSFKPEAAREKAAEAREKMVEKAGDLREKGADIREKAKERAEALSPEQKQKLGERAAARREMRKERIKAGREKLESERLNLSELKKGDRVFVGFDKDSNAAYTILRGEGGASQPAAQETSTKQPATVK